MGKAHLSYADTGSTYDSAFSASLALHFRCMPTVGPRTLVLKKKIYE
ncbi:MAG: hypothetical protein KC427_08675 [Sulfurovum sp.]|nr:hypothetical protein [Sulfurovum sp.]MCO4846076.1 hypothetical protein [Sulfurovum sp.]